ncbi:MAG: hypothetical protein JXK93_01120 [Sphaerochaetaceae bacterium]|nr:hypothetical protein [Sphaerochaetaceae bacterium]
MKITTVKDFYDDELESFCEVQGRGEWTLVVSGYWGQDMYHSGHVAYYMRETVPGTWVLQAVQRNTELDGVSEEDVEEGRLNDDQIQAMWGMTLEEAQYQIYEHIVAVVQEVPVRASRRKIAKALYSAALVIGAYAVEESDDKESLL